MKLARRDVRRGFFDKVLREKHALVARMLSSPPFARPRYAPEVKATERLASSGLGHFVFVRRPDATSNATTSSNPSAITNATAIFVATDATYFGGDLALLSRIRAASERHGATRPAIVLFDFVVHPIQIARAAAFGADAAVVQPGLVGPAELHAILAEANRVGLEIIADVSTQDAADAARDAGASALLVSGIDWDLLRPRPLPVIEAGALPAYAFEPPSDDACLGLTARIATGSLGDVLDRAAPQA